MNVLIIDRARYNILRETLTFSMIASLNFLAIKEENGTYSVVKDRSGQLSGSMINGEFCLTFEKQITTFETVEIKA